MLRASAYAALAPALLSMMLAVGAPAAAADAGRYIVVLRAPVAGEPVLDAHQRVQSLLGTASTTTSIRPEHVYGSAISGFAAQLTSIQVAALESDPRVAEVVPDQKIELADAWPTDDQPDTNVALNLTPNPTPTATATDAPGPTPTPTSTPTPTPTPKPRLPTPGPDRQIVPTGVQRVGRPSLDGARLNGGNEHADVDIAIVDTGVSDHPDLDVAGGVDCTGSHSGWHDREGHGTHVAGTAAAKDNNFGVVGVAPGARIWSVKVLNSHGYGYASWLLCGVDWIANQRDGDRPLIEVANMSLQFHGVTRRADDGNCGLTNHDPVHQAICTSTDQGTMYVVAAGNSERDSSRFRPAAYDEVMTVSALSDFDGKPGGRGSHWQSCPPGYSRDRDDVLANFSDFGPDIDIMAPGKCIWSTFIDDRYKAMSGTSMATPHVSGAVALYRIAHPGWTLDEIRSALLACGTQDWLHRSDRDHDHEPLLNVARLC